MAHFVVHCPCLTASTGILCHNKHDALLTGKALAMQTGQAFVEKAEHEQVLVLDRVDRAGEPVSIKARTILLPELRALGYK
jgi:hypothetical protein